MLVGILGDGQLAKMMVEAALPLGIDTMVLGNSKDRSAIGGLSEKQYVKGDINNYDDVYSFCKKVESLTVEIEHFNLDAVRDAVKDNGLKVFPSVEVLGISQDKHHQKKWLVENSLPTARTYSEDEIIKLSIEESGPLVAKPRLRGFDGRGIDFLDTEDDLLAWREKNRNNLGEYVVEEKLDVVSELAITVIRWGPDNQIRAYPCVETIQKNGMCRAVIAPAPYSKNVSAAVGRLANLVAECLNLDGLICVELFYCEYGLYINEIAPRPHNTAHYTIDACITSQFEQVMRLAAGFEPGVVEMLYKRALMFNLVGVSQDHTLEQFEENARGFAMNIPRASLHLYKKTPKPNRKIGHVTLLGKNIYNMLDLIASKAHVATTFESPSICFSGLKSRKYARGHDVAVVMGSKSDLPTMKPAIDTLKMLDIPAFVSVVSAHRTPDRMYYFAKTAREEGFKVIIAAAGGAAHLPGMLASLTSIPVIGVPVSQKNLSGADSLYSIVQMPAGIPVASVAIDNSTNAALLAAEILSLNDESLADALEKYRSSLKSKVISDARSMEEEYGTLDYSLFPEKASPKKPA